MGASKSILFTKEQNAIAEMSKALGHPARVAILEYLIKAGVCVCGDIVHVLPLAQATVSQHLKELKNAGLIKACIEGNNVCYCINPDALQLLGNFISCISNNFRKDSSDCCN